jgi:hypothetical protein
MTVCFADAAVQNGRWQNIEFAPNAVTGALGVNAQKK